MTATTTTTFNESGVSFKASTAVTKVQRANVFINADKSPMSYKDICDGLYSGDLKVHNFYRVVLAYQVGDTIKGIKLNHNRLQLAGQRDSENRLVGAAKETHSFLKDRAKLLDCSNIRGTITVGSKHGDFYFGYQQDGNIYNPCIASISATYEKDIEAHAEIMALKAANPDLELQVYYVPTEDFAKWCKFMKATTAKSA